MASQKRTWRVIDGPNQWSFSVAFWESLPGDKKVVTFKVIDPNKPEDLHMLQMEVLVMGRGSAQNMDLFFCGPSVLFLWIDGKKNTFGASKDVGKAKVSGYSIYDRHGELTFTADLDSCFA